MNITVGARVTKDGVGDAGEVFGITNAATVKWDNGTISLWPVEDLKVEVKKTRGQIIQELRKAAGLPEFIVGDVVRWNVCENDWNESTINRIDGINRIYGHDKWQLYVKDKKNGTGVLPVDNCTLVTPAPSTHTVALQPLATMKYKEGDFVRFMYGDFAGRVAFIEKAYEDDNSKPYLVTLIDEYDGEWVTESELEPWEPKVDERVQIKDTYEECEPMRGVRGRILAADDDCFDWVMLLDEEHAAGHDCEGNTPNNRGYWVDTVDIIPIAEEAKHAFKRGDIVELTDESLVPELIGTMGIVNGENTEVDGLFNVILETGEHILSRPVSLKLAT